jgi:integrase
LIPVATVDYGDGSDLGPTSSGVGRWPTIQEWKQFESHIAECPLKWGSRQSALWTVAAETGMRCGELAGVSKHQNGDTSDLDWERKVLNVRRSLGSDHGITYAKVPKSRNGRRTIALFESTVMALRAHTEQIQIEADISPRWLEPLTLSNSRATGTTVVDLMFRNPDGSALNPTNISQAFISEWDHAGLRKGVSLHGLRHLHASILLEGNPSKKVQPWSIAASPIYNVSTRSRFDGIPPTRLR